MPMIKDELGRYVEPPFHAWFGLTYSHYLVIPRSILEAMPLDWQNSMIALLDEARDKLDTDKIQDRYSVQLRGSDVNYVPDPFANYRHPPVIPFKHRVEA